MVFATNNTLRMTIEADGTVSTAGAFQPAGNVTCGANLTVNGGNLHILHTDADAAAGPIVTLQRDNSGSEDNGDILGEIKFQGSDSANTITTEYSTIHSLISNVSNTVEEGTLVFKNMVAGTSTTAMTIAGSKVGIGNTGPAHTFTVEDNVNAYTASFKNNRNPSSSAPYGVMIRFHETPDNGTSEFLRCDDSVGSSAVVRCIISSEGDLTNHDNSYGATSDKRIKQGIKDANSQWDDIKAVKVRNFKKNDDVAQYGDKAWEQIGVIAQELEEAGMDKLVREHPANESEVVVNDDINEGDMVKTVSYSVLYMKAIKALQEAMTKIETLETKVEALENA